MEGRRAGLLVLLLAVVLLIAVPRALSGGVAGEAVRAPLPAPPPVGSCLLGERNEVVDCGLPHDAEVTSVRAAGTPAATRDSCQDNDGRLAALTGEYGAYWSPPPVNARFPRITGPSDVTDSRFTWSACLVVPAVPASYRGTIMTAGDPAERPGAYGECADKLDPNLLLSAGQVSCLKPHGIETLGYASGFVPDDPALVDLPVPAPVPEALVQQQCIELGTHLIGNADPTFDGRLQIAAQFQRDSSSLIMDDTTIPGTAVTAACTVRPTGGKLLIDSVVGLGAGQLPVQ